MKKSLGSKRKFIGDSQREQLLQTYQNFEENEHSKIFENEFFGYTKVTIEQPTMKNGKEVRDKNGNPKPDSKLRDSERVPLSEDVEEYFTREVEPHLPNSWIDFDKSKVGYEINFTKYFYQYKPLRSSDEISQNLLELKKESENLLNLIMN
jgi:type I restriction enzyme M protein